MSAPKISVGRAFGALLGTLGLSALAGLLVTVMVAPAIAVTGITASSTIGIFESLPEYLEINQGAQKNEIVIKQGKKTIRVADVFYQNREEVSLSAMSEYLSEAAIAGEDRRFYEHGGVDAPSVIRAAIGEFTGQDAGGASTLTMQFVRNVIVNDIVNDPDLTEEQIQEQYNAAVAPTYDRKIQEMKYAIGIEKRYTKNEILEGYLNIANFGYNTYGVQAAAQQYFGTIARRLTLAQSASLIAIVQYPDLRNLGDPDNFAANQARRDVILGNMLELGYVTQDEYDEAINTPVDEDFVDYQTPENGCLSAADRFQFACDYATTVIDELESLGADETERRNNWRTGGYTIVLTIDAKVQKKANTTVKQYAPANYRGFNLGAAVSSVEVGTGRILSMAQNKKFNNTAKGGGYTSTAVNFNADVAHGGGSGFQPGSTYKPYVLLAFLDAGHGLGEGFNAGILEANQADFADSCGGPWGGTFDYQNDAGESGLYTAQRGTQWSVNSVFIQMAEEVDQCRIKELAASIGVHRGDGAQDGSLSYDEGGLQTRPSCAIGGCENNIAPLTQAAAYAAIANKGVYCKPIIIDDVLDQNNESIGGQTEECGQSLVRPEVATAAAYAMNQVTIDGTATASNPNDGTAYLAKTGTTDNSVHTWMVGSSSKVSTAVWVGNIKGQQPTRQAYVNGIQAAVLRHSIFRPIAITIDQRYPGRASFPAPDAQYLTGTTVEVPDVTGLSLEQAKSAIEVAGLTFREGSEVDSDVSAGLVVTTNPGSGAEVSKGTVVNVRVSNGEGAIVPDVVGLASFGAAKGQLQSAGFSNITEVCLTQDEDDPDPPAEGSVVGQGPSAGRMVNKNKEITVRISRADCS